MLFYAIDKKLWEPLVGHSTGLNRLNKGRAREEGWRKGGGGGGGWGCEKKSEKLVQLGRGSRALCHA